MSKRHRFAHNFILTLLLLLCATAGYGAPPEIDAVQKVDASAENSSKKKQKSKKQRKQRKKVVRGNAPCLAWLPQNTEARAAILCVHGLGLHNGTWEPFGKTMSQRGYAVYAIDVHGFGSWMEARGEGAVDFASCLEDVRRTLKVIKRAHKALPVFILQVSRWEAPSLFEPPLCIPDLVDGLISSVPAGDRFNQTRNQYQSGISPDK
ncbi:MAG: alpha/beta hydrolase [Cyanobacteriota/Melainabacteria group bacterium]